MDASGTVSIGVPRPVPVVVLRVAGTLDSKRPYDGGPLGRSNSDAYLVITRYERQILSAETVQ
jgi:poly(3-hydroxybutyrate) depolymerase